VLHPGRVESRKAEGDGCDRLGGYVSRAYEGHAGGQHGDDATRSDLFPGEGRWQEGILISLDLR
jgi:hypothetical protein